MQYIRKEQKVEAAQFVNDARGELMGASAVKRIDSGSNWESVIVPFCGYDNAVLDTKEPYFLIRTRFGNEPIRNNDWVTRDEKGRLGIVRDDIFQEEYAAAPKEDPKPDAPPAAGQPASAGGTIDVGGVQVPLVATLEAALAVLKNRKSDGTPSAEGAPAETDKVI